MYVYDLKVEDVDEELLLEPRMSRGDSVRTPFGDGIFVRKQLGTDDISEVSTES